MKELSIEEKAKAYDEAIEKARMWKNKSGMPKDRQGILDDIFPELKENEDERIRKSLIDYFGRFDARNEFDENIEFGKVVDWIKKQGEQKPAEWTMDNIEELTEFENAMMHIGGSFFGEHQGLDPNDTFVVKEQAKILLEMAPKQEWSAKDENFLNTTIAYLRDAYSKDKIDFKDTAKNCVNWLKSLRPQNTITDEELDKAKKDAYNDAFDDGWSAAICYLKKRNCSTSEHLEAE